MTNSEIIFTVTENPEGVFEAAALGHSIFTEADTFEELKDMVRDAVCCHFDDGERPSVIRLHLVKDIVLPARDCRGTSPERGSPSSSACPPPPWDPPFT